jgi:hypothetical protein
MNALCDGEGDVDAAQDLVGIGLAVEESLAFEVTLLRTKETLKNMQICSVTKTPEEDPFQGLNT